MEAVLAGRAVRRAKEYLKLSGSASASASASAGAGAGAGVGAGGDTETKAEGVGVGLSPVPKHIAALQAQMNENLILTSSTKRKKLMNWLFDK